MLLSSCVLFSKYESVNWSTYQHKISILSPVHYVIATHFLIISIRQKYEKRWIRRFDSIFEIENSRAVTVYTSLYKIAHATHLLSHTGVITLPVKIQDFQVFTC